MSDETTAEQAIDGPWAMLGNGEAIVGNHGKRPVVVAAAMRGEHAGRLVTRDPDTGLLVRLTYDHPNARVIMAAPAALAALRLIDLPAVAEPDSAEASWGAITIELTADAYLAIRAALAQATPEAR